MRGKQSKEAMFKNTSDKKGHSNALYDVLAPRDDVHIILKLKPVKTA